MNLPTTETSVETTNSWPFPVGILWYDAPKVCVAARGGRFVINGVIADIVYTFTMHCVKVSKYDRQL
jgi:hypothetical protein